MNPSIVDQLHKREIRIDALERLARSLKIDVEPLRIRSRRGPRGVRTFEVRSVSSYRQALIAALEARLMAEEPARVRGMYG